MTNHDAVNQNVGSDSGDSKTIAPGKLIPGQAVCLKSNPHKTFAIVDRRGPLVELETEHGSRFRVGYKALRWPASEEGKHEQA